MAVMRRKAFTLIELVIVVAIICVVVALTIPAVLRVRESANSTRCANHLRQIGLAFHLHHEALGYFPTGGRAWSDPPTYTAGGTPTVGRYQNAGWAFQILPYLGQEAVWLGGDGKTNQERVLVALSTPQETYFCPSRREPMVYAYCPPRPASDPLADNIYDLQWGSRPAIFTAQCDYLASNYNWQQGGVVRKLEPRRMAEITDGLSSTLMVGEKRVNLRMLGTTSFNNDQGYADGWDGDTVGRTDVAPGRDVNLAPWEVFFLVRPPFGSSHPNRFNAVFADGSVRSISYRIDLDVFRALGDIQDGKTKGVP